MGTERARRQARRSDSKVLKDFGINQMQADLQLMATNVTATANGLHKLGKQHDALVKKCADKAEADENSMVYMERHRRMHEENLQGLNEVRNRGLRGRLKWLLTGR